MADYFPLISRAVTGLEKSSGEARRALYDRARKALVDQLRGVTPALSETDITRERLALEEAIRKVETEEVKRTKPEVPAAASAATARAREALRAADAPRSPPVAPMPDADPWVVAEETVEEQAAPEQAAAEQDVTAVPEPQTLPVAPSPPPPTRSAAAAELRRPRRNLFVEDGAAESRSGVVETENTDRVETIAKRSAQDTIFSAPPLGFEGAAPRGEPERRRTPRKRLPERRSVTPGEVAALLEPATVEDESPYRNLSATRSLDSVDVPDEVKSAASKGRRAQADPAKLSWFQRALKRAIRIGIVVLLIALFAGLMYWKGDALLAMVRNAITMARSPSVAPQPRDTTPQRPKIPDRIGQQDAVPDAGQNAQRGQSEVAVAQRVVLYEEDPNDSAGKRYLGSIVWRAETVSPGPGQPPDRAVRGDITIPERNMSIAWSLRRNTDKDLPASHTVSVQFTLPADFSHGGVAEIRGLLMKQAEQTRGVSLAGLSVKVTTGYFLVGLSSAPDDAQRNTQLLKERDWFDIAIVYNDGRRAILAVEKGTPGARAFADAFAAWGQ